MIFDPNNTELFEGSFFVCVCMRVSNATNPILITLFKC